jgi:hypothetical protein
MAMNLGHVAAIDEKKNSATGQNVDLGGAKRPCLVTGTGPVTRRIAFLMEAHA